MSLNLISSLSLLKLRVKAKAPGSRLDAVSANANKRKCQISQSPIQDIESQCHRRTQVKRQCQTTTDV